MKSIVVGVDGSVQSRKAVTLAAEIAAATKSKVVLAYVLVVPSPPEVLIPSTWTGELTETGQAILAAAAAQCAKAGVSCESRILDGAPDEALAHLAAELGADLIAVGSRGRGAVSRLLQGSVATRLVQTAGRPVLVAR